MDGHHVPTKLSLPFWSPTEAICLIDITQKFADTMIIEWVEPKFDLLFNYLQRGYERSQQETSEEIMALLLKLIALLMLQVGVSLAGFQLNFVRHFKREGEDILLSCGFEGCSDQCAELTWMHRRHVSEDDLLTEQISFEGKVNQSLPRASRMSLTSNCSLLIRNLHVEDAGLYGWRNVEFVDILSISSSPSDVAERVDLKCSLNSYNEIGNCHPVRIIWVDETGTELSGKNAEFEVNLQDNCVSILTVKRQSGNKKFTCKVVEDNKVMIDAVYILTE
ncbi:hypothetical protein OJAV_G00230890 [Oryzias javanicus]|uniref:Ig-like domain-containing protein n=1 Tax=Oryzias javanicus TaxID=123683 RepID=A0A3S2NTD4_ORYJA|nr:hypothetical protein OJAV_G00230890 [Oryzias javanicus]